MEPCAACGHACLRPAPQEPSKGVDAARASFVSSRRSIEALSVQPEFLAGGTLRDYQLDGINWLTYAWIKVSWG